MKRIRTGLLPLFLVLLVTLAACAPAAPTPAAEPTQAIAVPPLPPTDAPTAAAEGEPTASASTAFTLTDALGREVTFAEPPQRIVIAGRATQLLVDSAYLFPEAVDRVVAIEQRLQSTDFIELVDPTAGEIEFLERDAGAEQIAPLAPDVVIMKTYMNETIGAGLEQIGIPVVYLELETPEQFARDVRILGEVFGNAGRAEAIVAAYAERAGRITTAAADLAEAERPSVLLLQHSETGGEVAFEVPPAEWLQTTMVELAGGRPVWKDAALGGGWQVV
ncbi:MAG TPA: ABC transporter substrate-binding protein, partial [Anaerolineaceae bacterium]|nr:ABC transporter substrate-binding protein [Anaerolineaceae bacterium]